MSRQFPVVEHGSPCTLAVNVHGGMNFAFSAAHWSTNWAGVFDPAVARAMFSPPTPLCGLAGHVGRLARWSAHFCASVASASDQASAGTFTAGSFLYLLCASTTALASAGESV